MNEINKTSIVTVVFLSVLVLLVASCKNSKLRDHYSGFVVDEAGVPISGVWVRACFSVENSDTTNHIGYFKIKRADNTLEDLIFSKKDYRTDTVDMVWLVQGEKEIYSDLITSDSGKWVMRKKVYRDSLLNSSDKLRIYENDSIEMRRDERIFYTQYLNRPKGEVIYRHYEYDGTPGREVYSTDRKVGQIHFRDFNRHDSDEVENIGYVSIADSIPNPLNEDWSQYKYISVIKSVRGGQLLSEAYLIWNDRESYVMGKYGEIVLRKTYYDKDGSYNITRYTDEGTISCDYHPNGQLSYYGVHKSLYGATFSTFYVRYDSLGHKTERVDWEHLYPEWGNSYNDTFSVATTREYYLNGKLKSLTKIKSFAESESYRCGTWIYYDEKGKILKTEKYGNCYNFKLEEKYADYNFHEEEE